MGEERFGRYRLERLLGKGGMGQVWLAYDTVVERRVALKLLPAELATDAKYRKRFEREAEVIAALRDPHVVPIHTHGEIDGRLFIDMEFIEGIDLGVRLQTDGPIPPAVSVSVIEQVASALDAAHRVGLVHRDVKPSNIVLRADGAAYLIDFGLAHSRGQTALTATGFAMGTWAYMAPERYTGNTDGRSDVYSLACVLYECLTARRPYGDTDPPQQMHAHLMSAPPRASSLNPVIPPTLDGVIARGLAKDPVQRYQSAGEFARNARAALEAGKPPTKLLAHQDIPQTRIETRIAPMYPHPGFAQPVPAGAPIPQPNPQRGRQRTHPVTPHLPHNQTVMPRAGAVAPQVNAPQVNAPQPPGHQSTGHQPPAPQPTVLPPTAHQTHVLQPNALQPNAYQSNQYPAAPSRRQWYLRRQPARPTATPWPVRPPAPAPRRRKSRTRRFLIAIILILLSPFLLLAGCAVLVLLADGDGGGSPAPSPASVNETDTVTPEIRPTKPPPLQIPGGDPKTDPGPVLRIPGLEDDPAPSTPPTKVPPGRG
ncbi:serine/threonine-protein kinase [Nocardia arthritidis]|uniref:non-specific serine/threonine protein kinase n=1 Tax=Nocardia arthritidis TaxID=228602 RepID=A0A6G9Y7R7_9NOCA|nr:serine/threonine-protein kinase [Nocardia arthritidis]QIS09262.1 protein kinase [Nocardia arthritidis]